MPALDRIHDAVRTALEHDGWIVTHDPYVIRYADLTLFADLGAERAVAIERDNRKVVVEIKSLTGASLVQELKLTLGQYDLYRGFLEVIDPERELYIAISDTAYNTMIGRPALALILRRYRLPLLIVDLEREAIVQWLPTSPTSDSSGTR
jgi:hypothetical protein